MGFDRYDYDEEVSAEQKHEARIRRCRTCNRQIIWFRTPEGRNMPVDADTVEAKDEVLDLKRHRSHFATCEQADLHRKPRR